MTARAPEASAAAETVLTFLESVGRRSEAELYLRLFRQLPKESFAVIATEATVVRQALGALAEQLVFLSQLGLYAPVLLGLFDPAQAEPGAERLAKRLPKLGVGVARFGADAPELAERLREVLVSERVPIVHFAPEPDVEPRQRFTRLAALAGQLGSRKVVLLRRRGGLVVRGGRPAGLALGEVKPSTGAISVLNLRADRDVLLGSRHLSPQDQQLLEHADQLLAEPGAGALVVNVTSPSDLLKELFTVRGAGTLIKAGSELDRHATYDDVDRPRLQALLELSFGRRLKPGFFEQAPLGVIVERDYRGAAVVLPGVAAPYLSKFAVEPVAQGEGIGNDLWQALTRDYPSLYWRTREGKPIASFYAKVCQGMQRQDPWHVFWRDVPAERIPVVIEEAVGKQEDFE